MRKKSDLIDALAEKTGATKADAKAILDALPEIVATALREDGEIVLPGIGTLKKTQRAARSGRNPQTGEALEIAASTSASLKVTKPLKDAISA
ncbi:HU family DNA-binding protein [Vreelandella rituensis]|uniref:HU family DNA-binding protein n=1 Tax=Vreelandella rituensis TaxID=2282306 RepID=A0A368U9J8_9GAMM|nr:HU family DNA-binding protein [Halomonas rituensis]RCV93780.1 HU family DNA-binding protein [Halomonas rituensis]